MGHSLASYWRQLYGGKRGNCLSLTLIVSIQEREKDNRDCFSNIPGQNGIFTQPVLMIKVLVSFTRSKWSKMIQSK